MSSLAPQFSPLRLPRVIGPKLEPYGGNSTAEINFVCRIGEGVDSDVWKISIDGHFYALKIFYFRNWEWLQNSEIEGGWAEPSNRSSEVYSELTPQDYVDHLDPFGCECRAYGRLKQEGREDVAVRAYGYVLLTPDQERRVTEASGLDYEDVRAPGAETMTLKWGRPESHRHEPLRAIVKEFINDKETSYFVFEKVPQMYEDLETLHSLGILVRDVHAGNYLGSKLIDFSRAWTMCHPCLERATDQALCKLRQDELQAFLDATAAWDGDSHPELETRERIAQLSKTPVGEDLGINPRDYDWRKWEHSDHGGQVKGEA